ncbi:MAG: cysteine--tRNA ligase [Alphaproteobacteria bacterium]|nr:cysteine--tRNA ligase [Alphaproteobacteria bacterium]MBT4019963.1 cysteine--tRNA ligase [Alphaproteobacteria bacterium]MBT4966762.1 cysteine--tRNA ligase [Alphaproteobacteria bacterium]
MALSLYNTRTREKQLFEPLSPGRVGMYVCGPTVYDFAHVGNARPVIVFDVLYRLLKKSYEHVRYVRNITDVDDKIIAAAEQSGDSIDEITARTTEAYHEDMAALGALPPDIEPRATDHVPQMIIMIERLIARGNAYEADGHVLFAVETDKNYGKLSGRNRDEMIAGARVEVAPYKKDPADFVLWKPSTGEQPGWESPWGYGRPGWHIECSAMSREYLGMTFDIHGGGRDLVFPHHENEVAQSTCAHDEAEFARYWVHNGFLTVEGEKMSKSIGNILLVRDILAGAPGEAIRLNMLSSHYRQPLDWTEGGVTESRTILDRWYRAAADAEPLACDAVIEALEDDLNTPKAIAALHELSNAASQGDALAAGQLRGGANLMGLLMKSQSAWFKGLDATEYDISFMNKLAEPLPEIAERIDEQVRQAIDKWDEMSGEQQGTIYELCINLLIDFRKLAREHREFQTSDIIRDLLLEANITLEDGPDGTTWRRTV